jgi:hypothetical protein
MALDQSAIADLLDALRAGGDLDVIREGLALVLQALIEAEATEVIGADRYQRSAGRTTHRNGTRARLLSTKAGDVQLPHPQAAGGLVLPRVAGATPPHRPGLAGRGHGGLCARHLHPQGRRPGQGVGGGRRISKSESAGSAGSWTPRWPPSGPARWPTPPSPLCSWMPPTSRPVWPAGWCRRRW